MKGLIAFVVLIIAPLIYFIIEPGLAFRQAGGSWLPFVLAPFQAAVFAFIVSGKPGTKLAGQDDQGNWLLGRFWAVFIFLTVILLGAAIALKLEA
jgi:hypothetical protein